MSSLGTVKVNSLNLGHVDFFEYHSYFRLLLYCLGHKNEEYKRSIYVFLESYSDFPIISPNFS